VSEKDTIMLNTCELPGSKHSPYKPGLHQNEELASDYVQTHQEIDCTMTQIPLHSHPFFELSYVRRCQNTDYSIGAKKYRLNVGDILLIPPDTLHGAVLSNEKQSQLVRDVLWLSPHFLNRMRLMTSGTQTTEQRNPSFSEQTEQSGNTWKNTSRPVLWNVNRNCMVGKAS